MLPKEGSEDCNGHIFFKQKDDSNIKTETFLTSLTSIILSYIYIATDWSSTPVPSLLPGHTAGLQVPASLTVRRGHATEF